MEVLSIGEVAQRSGVSIDAIRYYEREGVLPEPERGAGGRRTYDASILDALVLVNALREVGFGIADIRQVMGLKDVRDFEKRTAIRKELGRLERILQDRARAVRTARSIVRTMCAEVDAADGPCTSQAAPDRPVDDQARL